MGRRLFPSLVGLLVLGWIAASAVLFLWPEQDSPKRANAVVVLSGGKVPRLEKALALMRGQVAPVLVISDGWDPHWPQANRLCAGHPRFEVVCFKPDPYSTQGEAEAVARLAARRKWHSIVLVTSRYHVTRARLLFDRCFRGRVDAVGARFPLSRLPSFVLSEWGKLVYVLTIDRDC